MTALLPTRSALPAHGQSPLVEPASSITDDVQLPAWAVSYIASMEMENCTLRRNLTVAQHLATHDDVTGLPNRRAALRVLARLLSRAQRGNDCLAVLFIDGDSLKHFNNDSYAAGDAMIARLASVLSDALRPTDFLARWLCGDEFLAVLPGVSGPTAHAIAERLRASVERAFAGGAIPVTVSIGVTTYPEHASSGDSLVAQAISANILAKHNGKNQVVLAARS